MLPEQDWDIFSWLYALYAWFVLHDAVGKLAAVLVRHAVEDMNAKSSQFLGKACTFLVLVPLAAFLGYCSVRLLLYFVRGEVRRAPRGARP